MSEYGVKDAEKDAIGVSTRVDPVYLESGPEKHHVHLKDVDEVAKLVAGLDRTITEEENKRVLRKIDWRILPLMMLLYFMQFADKNTLNGANVMGLQKDTHMTQSQYNWLTTIFYIAYLAFEWPQTLGLQYFPVSKWMSANIVVWGIAVACIAACKNWAGIFVCRLVMGACEGVMTSGFLILTSMFYTQDEATRRVGYWFLMNGTAQIFNALLSFGILHVTSMNPWRVYFIICGLLTVLIGVAWLFVMPDGPAKARFLTPEERIIAVERLKGKSGGIENKTWKKDQFIEAVTDPKVWALSIFALLNNFGNSLMNMSGVIIKSFGYSVSQTLLLGCVPGAIEIVVIWYGNIILKYIKQRGIVAAFIGFPAIIGGVMVVALPWTNKSGLLAGLYLTGAMTPSFVIVLAWNSLLSAGHTKKTTANMMFLIGYCVGNLCSPQLWQAKFAPRYYVPWGVILACWIFNPFIALTVRFFLKKENARRDALVADPNYVQERYYDDDGNEIDPTFMDITDKKNMAFRYPL